MVWHVTRYDVIPSIYPSSLIHSPIQSAFLSSQLIKISTNFFKKADKALAHRVLTELIQSSLSDDYSSNCHRFDLDHQELSELIRKGRKRRTYSSQPQQNQYQGQELESNDGAAERSQASGQQIGQRRRAGAKFHPHQASSQHRKPISLQERKSASNIAVKKDVDAFILGCDSRSWDY